MLYGGFDQKQSQFFKECTVEAVGDDTDPAAVPSPLLCLKDSAKHQLGARLRSIAEKDGGVIEMECAWWCQLYLIASAPAFEQVAVGLGGDMVWTVAQAAGARAGMHPGYFSVLDSEVHMRTAPWLGRARGRWVVGPDANDRYVGLGDRGPLRLTLREWHDCISKDVAHAVRHNNMPRRMRLVLAKFMEDGAFAFDNYAVMRKPKYVPPRQIEAIQLKMEQDRADDEKAQ
jgi:hypothetical protein